MKKKEIEEVILWIREQIEKMGAKGVVIGNSGGKDSAVVIALATQALGKENVLTVAMPCQSTVEDRNDANLVANAFGVEVLELNLSIVYEILEKIIEEQVNLREEAKVNIKPRLRMTTLYGIAQSKGYVVMGTGNLCEAMVGYTTKWGDSAYDLNPIANFTVEEVLEIGDQLGVPKKILSKAPNDGLGGKTDEEKLGVTYQQIGEYIQKGKTDEEAMKKIEEKYRNSNHKRIKVPVYERKKRNYLEERMKKTEELKCNM